MRISRGGFKVREHTLVRVHCKNGLTGLGEGIGNAKNIESMLVGGVAQQALGVDVFANELFHFKMCSQPTYFEKLGSYMSAFSALEMAMWDLKAKILNVPCYQLLGGQFREKIRAYASDIYWNESIPDLCNEASRIVNNGFGSIKAHLGVMPPREETIRVAALRHVIGKEINLMIDLNCGYDIRDAKEALSRWSEFDLYWLEEPLLPELWSSMSLLRSISTIPIASGENEFGLTGFQNMFNQGAVDVAMPDVGRVGGITELKNISSLAGAHGVVVSPHNFSSGVLLAATAHLMASSANMDLIEVDTSGNSVYEEILSPTWSIKEGFVYIPDDVGLGVMLPESVLEKYGISREVFE